ncbi:hypothetical protein D3C75_607820 [compost metagenome]
MTQELQIIEKIGFEDGTTILLEDLPEALRNEVHQYNAWTAQLAEIGKSIAELEGQAKVLSYARSGAYGVISQSAAQLQQQISEQKAEKDETSAPVDEQPNLPVDTQDPQ